MKRELERFESHGNDCIYNPGRASKDDRTLDQSSPLLEVKMKTTLTDSTIMNNTSLRGLSTSVKKV